MLPPSNVDSLRPQVVPGKRWIAHFGSIVFVLAFAGVIFTGPDRLRESLLVSVEPQLVTLDELRADQSRDPRHVILPRMRVETVAEKKARKGALPGMHLLHSVDAVAAEDADDRDELLLFVACNNAVLPPGVAAQDAQAEIAADVIDNAALVGAEPIAVDANKNAALEPPIDLSDMEEFVGVLRRPNPLAYRTGLLTDDCGIPHDAWLLMLDTKPYQASASIAMVATGLLIGGLMLMIMMSQNWIPRTGLSFNPWFGIVSLFGWPLRRYRDRWTMRFAFLSAGVANIVLGCWFVATSDAGIVADAYFLEHWAAAIGLCTLGLGLFMRAIWVTVRRAPMVSTTSNETEPDDERAANDPLLSKSFVSLRTICGGVGLAILAARILNNVAGNPAPWVMVPIAGYAMTAMILASGLFHWLIQISTRGFREKAYEPLEQTTRAVRTYREKSDETLQATGFEHFAAYRVRGSAFSTNIELHLGCNGMVIAEFLTLSGTKAIELTSITESGISVSTCTSKAAEGSPETRWTGTIHVRWAGTQDLQKLLQVHLSAVADIAEQNDTSIALLTTDDVIDVLKYGGRAFHDMKFQQGETTDRVGPMTYGRFRFPTGLVPTDQRTDQPTGATEPELVPSV